MGHMKLADLSPYLKPPYHKSSMTINKFVYLGAQMPPLQQTHKHTSYLAKSGLATVESDLQLRCGEK